MDWKKDERSASACKISISASEFCWGQVGIASRGKMKKLCMEVKAGTSADGYIRALRGSGGLKSLWWGLGQSPRAAVDSGARRRRAQHARRTHFGTTSTRKK